MKNLILILFVSNFCLSSCGFGPQLLYTEKLALHKGISIEEFKKSGCDYDTHQILKNTSETHKSSIEIYMGKQIGSHKKEIYYYAFANGKLLYWGFPYQFARSDDQILNDIAEEAFPIAKVEYGLNLVK
jgi:hypothetical protein